MNIIKSSRLYSVITLLSFAPVSMSTSYAQNTTLFPFQAPLPYKQSHFFINPNEMSSWGVAKVFPKHHTHFKKIIDERNWFPHDSNHSYEVKLETPSTRNISYGADILFLNHRINPNSLKNNLNLNDFFSDLSSIQFLGNIKLKKLITSHFGYLALTASYKTGLNCIFQGISTQHKGYNMDIGVTFGPSLGVDYYINQWVGVFIEGSLYHTIMPSLPKQNTQSDSATFAQPSAINPAKRYYRYTMTTLKIGFKTTF